MDLTAAIKADTTKAAQSSYGTSRPIQILSWADKIKDEKLWFRQNVDFLIAKASFTFQDGTPGMSNHRKDLRTLYEVYNNQFPMSWFQHVTNPLSAKKKQHKAFPGKIRPVTILRTNLDLLMGEYPKRPFSINVTNLGESGYSRFMEGMKEQAQNTLNQHFVQAVLDQAMKSGEKLSEEQMAQLQAEPPVPEEVKEEYQSSYKDAITIKAQKWLRRTMKKEKIRNKFQAMFKDWVIAGQAYSYKGIQSEKLIYKRVSPLKLDYDKSEQTILIEDGDWVVYRDMWTISDVVDQAYPYLKEENLKELDDKNRYQSPQAFFSYLQGAWATAGDKIPVYHVQWKGRKKIGFLSYLDMETFQLVEQTVDEDYIVDREKGEQVEWRYVNEVYEGWKYGNNTYTQMDALPVQRNEMNNHSTCKLSYNGRKASDTHAENLSVLEIGLPFQIMYMIAGYTIEKTIAKSKGKILLLDQNTIPDEGEWDEEKFFYYAEGMGYALLNRNQVGVDKTWNQYQVVDMSLFEQLEQLIKLQSSFKEQWDEVIGINRQRKGQTFSSDGQGVNERAAFQSTVITDMIFMGFEEFTESELQGFLDLSKYLTSKGVWEVYNDDEYGHQLLEIMPEDFMMEELGVFADNSSEEMARLNNMKSMTQAMLQNKVKVSTVMEVVSAVNSADLRGKLKQIETIEEQINQINLKNERDAEAHADARKKDFMEYENLLKTMFMDKEYDRKEDIETLKGMYNTFTFQNGDANANGVPDALEVQKMFAERDKTMKEFDERKADRRVEQDKVAIKTKELAHKMEMDKGNLAVNQTKAKAAMIKAKQKPKSSAK